MNTRYKIPFLMVAAALTSCAAMPELPSEVVARSEIKFQPLNPARGDASPKAGVMWGDIKKNVASGVLIEFADGFSSPPHIHNITYRAVVISGAVHNDDPDAGPMWMGPGSFWTQPAGESHITAAVDGGSATAFLEIMEGPYLVESSDRAFDNGERPVNLDTGNIVWLDPSTVSWLESDKESVAANTPKMAFLWGTPQEGQKNGTFLKLPAGFNGELRGNGSWLRAVVIQGQTRLRVAGESDYNNLDPGSYFGTAGARPHQISCQTDDACIIYISTTGIYNVAGH